MAANYGVSGLQSASFFVNAADTRTRGAELVSNWRQSLGDGQLLLTGTYAYTKTTLKNVLATPAQLQALDPDYVLFGIEETNTLTDATPRTRGSFYCMEQRPLVAEHPREPLWQRHRVFNFGDGYIPRQTYQAEWQLDAEVEYRITRSGAWLSAGRT